MAARIYRAGTNVISEANGVQVGQWIFTDNPNLSEIGDFEIVHIDEVTNGAFDAAAVNILNDDTFRGTTALTEGNYVVDLTAVPTDWSPGDIVELRDATGGATPPFLVGRINSLNQGQTITFSGFVDFPENGVDTTAIITTGLASEIQIGQVIEINSIDYTVTANISIGSGSSLHVVPQIPEADRPAEGTTGTFEPFLEVFIFDPGTTTLAAAEEVRIANVSNLAQGEHFNFVDHGESDRPLYLTGGSHHYLVVPEGLEITANTL